MQATTFPRSFWPFQRSPCRTGKAAFVSHASRPFRLHSPSPSSVPIMVSVLTIDSKVMVSEACYSILGHGRQKGFRCLEGEVPVVPETTGSDSAHPIPMFWKKHTLFSFQTRRVVHLFMSVQYVCYPWVLEIVFSSVYRSVDDPAKLSE
ncbi:hypothetical protein Mapa_004237 [Marchantia paleacea]|nr:hypothetical protein Mapa_004237 [Marchantia paleacea]